MSRQLDEQRLRPDLVDTVFPLVEAIRKMLARVEGLWADVGVTPSEAAVLERLFIDHDGQARSGELLGHPIRSTPALGKVLASLEDKHLITRVRGERDRRVVVVTATGEAERLYEEMIRRILAVVVGPSTVNLDDDEFAQIRVITSKLRPPDASGW